MADPASILSIATGSASLLLQCAQLVKVLHRIAGAFENAQLTVLSAVHELDIIRLAWEQIQRLMQSWQPIVDMDEEIVHRMSRQLQFGTTVMDALSKDLPAIAKKSYSFTQATKIVWNEDLFKAHQDRIRGQAVALNLLLSVLQMYVL